MSLEYRCSVMAKMSNYECKKRITIPASMLSLAIGGSEWRFKCFVEGDDVADVGEGGSPSARLCTEGDA